VESRKHWVAKLNDALVRLLAECHQAAERRAGRRRSYGTRRQEKAIEEDRMTHWVANDRGGLGGGEEGTCRGRRTYLFLV
jgi:hypothetical protein